MGLFYRNQPFIFGETTYTNGGAFGPVHADSVNLVVVVEGSMEVRWDGMSAEIPAGRVALIYSSSSIEFLFPLGKRTVVRWCDTGEPAGSAWVRQKLKKAPLSLEVSETVRQLMDIGMKLSCQNRDEVRAFRDALGEALICAYLHQANLDWDEALVPEPVNRGKEFIESHFCEAIDNRQIVRRAGVSPQYLDRLFKRSHGLSPCSTSGACGPRRVPSSFARPDSPWARSRTNAATRPPFTFPATSRPAMATARASCGICSRPSSRACGGASTPTSITRDRDRPARRRR